MITFLSHYYQQIYFLLDLLGFFLASVLVVYMVNSLYLPKFTWLTTGIGYVLATAICMLILFFFSYILPFNPYLFTSVIVGVILLYSNLGYQCSFLDSFICSLFYVSCLSIIDMVFVIFNWLQIQPEDGSAVSIPLDTALIRSIVGKFLLYLIVRFFVKYRKYTSQNIPKSSSYIMVTAFISNLIIMFLLQKQLISNAFDSSFGFLILMLAFLSIPLCLSYYYATLSQSNEEKKKYQIQLREMELEYQYLNNQSSLYQKLSTFYHDYNSHLSYLYGMLESGHETQALAYLKHLQKSAVSCDTLIPFIEHASLNVLFNQKYQQAQKQHTDFRIHIYCPSSQIEIADIDLCSLISNICDNALTACQKIPNASFDLEMKIVKGYLTLKAVNTTAYDVLKENAELKSTKNDSELHGLGTGIILTIVHKYEGSFQNSSTPNSYMVSILLKNIAL